MTIIETKNGIYYAMTKKELLWLAVNEKNLPQVDQRDENIILLSPKDMQKLFKEDIKDYQNNSL